jgi:hypothetical protein
VENIEVVVRRSSSQGGPARTGQVLSRNAAVLRVRWDDDGLEEDARLGGSTMLAVLGSLRHQALLDPATLAVRLGEEPLEVVLQLLREQKAPLKTPKIKDQLKVLGLTPDAVDGAWRKVQGRLAGIEEVRIRKGTYQWIGAAAEARPAPVEKTHAEILAASDDPDARVWAEALAWHDRFRDGDTEAATAEFIRRFGPREN